MAAAPQYLVAWPAIALTNKRGAEKVFRHGEAIPAAYLTAEQAGPFLDLGAVAVGSGPTTPEPKEPKGDEPKGDEPKGDEPKEPKGDEPKEPKGDEPKEPKGDEPGGDDEAGSGQPSDGKK